MHHFPKDKVHSLVCHEYKPLHKPIIKKVLGLLEEPETRKTHLFNGRYENIYISEKQLPAITPILKMILLEAAKLLNDKPDIFKLGFWFNVMQKNDVTTLHSHDDDDELLSGTYYLQMPEHSGALSITMKDGSSMKIEPEEAALTFFHPSVAHEVSQHHSSVPRISIGFNIGSKENALQD